MLHHCNQAGEVKKIMALGEAARVYAEQQKLGVEAENVAKEIVIRAVRRLGEILAKQDRHKGGRPTTKPVNSEVQVPSLYDIGITRNQSSAAQRLAAIEEDRFEAAIARDKREDKKLSYKRIIKEFEASIGRKKKVDKKPRQTLSNAAEAIKRIDNFINAELSRVQREEERNQIVQGLKRIVELLLERVEGADALPLGPAAREDIEEVEIVQPPRSSRKRKTTRGRRTRDSPLSP
jgi:hypothetical protein